MTSSYTPLPDRCYNVKFGRSATKDVRINRKEPPKLGTAGTPPLGCPPKNKPLPHMCYRVKFANSATKGICIDRKEPR